MIAKKTAGRRAMSEEERRKSFHVRLKPALIDELTGHDLPAAFIIEQGIRLYLDRHTLFTKLQGDIEKAEYQLFLEYKEKLKKGEVD